jgi:hypothetical protein
VLSGRCSRSCLHRDLSLQSVQSRERSRATAGLVADSVAESKFSARSRLVSRSSEESGHLPARARSSWALVPMSRAIEAAPSVPSCSTSASRLRRPRQPVQRRMSSRTNGSTIIFRSDDMQLRSPCKQQHLGGRLSPLAEVPTAPRRFSWSLDRSDVGDHRVRVVAGETEQRHRLMAGQQATLKPH